MSSHLSIRTLVVASVLVTTAACTSILGNIDFNGNEGGGGTSSTTTTSTTGSGGTGGTAPMCQDPAKDCTAPADPCLVAMCSAGVCDTSPAPDTTVLPDPTPGDCQKDACDGKGNKITVASSTDIADDSDPCTIDTCGGTTPKHDPAPATTTCNTGPTKYAHVCGDPAGPKAGKCVECNVGDDASCLTPNNRCVNYTCVPNSCFNAVKDGTETDVNCGGSCLPCSYGQVCVADLDCDTGYCVGGVCNAAILATLQGGPTALAVDANNLYWLNTTDGSVVQVSKGSGAQGTIAKKYELASGQAGPSNIAVDGFNVYWVNQTQQPYPTVMSAPINTDGQPGPGASQVAELAFSPSGTIVCLNVSAVGVTASYANGGSPYCPFGGTKCFASVGGPSHMSACASDAAGFYVTDPVAGLVLETTPTSATLASSQPNPQGLAADGTFVYWTTYDGGGVYKTANTGGGNISPLATGQSHPRAIATDSISVYWSTDDGLMKVSAGGGGAVRRLALNTVPNALVVDDAYVYWTDTAAGQVRKIRK